jgi:hypothetical protein
VKVYVEQGKIQVFPRVLGTKHGVGRGATIDLEVMEKDEIEQLSQYIKQAITNQIHQGCDQFEI